MDLYWKKYLPFFYSLDTIAMVDAESACASVFYLDKNRRLQPIRESPRKNYIVFHERKETQ